MRNRADIQLRETVKMLREQYPAGTRVVLEKMDDEQAPMVGTKGTVLGIDDIASIMVQWDNGSRLHVLHGIDRCRKVDE